LKIDTNIELPIKVTINFTAISDWIDIRKQNLIIMLINLIDSPLNGKDFDIKCLGFGPSIMYLRFYKSSPKDLAEREPYIQKIIDEANNYQGAYRFDTLDICNKLDISFTTLWNFLYNLQSAGEIGYEAKDEGMFLEINKIPESFASILDYVSKTNLHNININFKKVNINC